MTTNIHFLSYFVHFFLEWEKFQKKVLEKIKTYILCSVTFFFRKSCRLRENVENYFRVGQATNDNTAREHCMLFHCNNGCTKASQFYAPRTSTVLFLLNCVFEIFQQYFFLIPEAPNCFMSYIDRVISPPLLRILYKLY